MNKMKNRNTTLTNNSKMESQNREGQTIHWPKKTTDKRTNNHLQNTTQKARLNFRIRKLSLLRFCDSILDLFRQGSISIFHFD
jgi:hypothetical protein